MPRRVNSIALILVLAIAIGLFSPTARGLARREKERGGALLAEIELEKRNQNALAAILGEVRASVADMMFIKTERYLHQGVAYAPHLDFNEMARSGEVVDRPAGGDGHGDAHDHDHDHEEVELLIRQAATDFRGFLGHLERAVKPFESEENPHTHTTGEELLPWYRLITLANPRSVRAYMIGAMWLNQQEMRDPALAFLEEGIAQNQDNPEVFRLYVASATLLIKSRHDSDQAETDWAARALDAAANAYRLALEVRPEDGRIQVEKKGLVWRDDLEEDFRFAGNYHALLLRETGRPDEALQAAVAFQRMAPDFRPIAHLIEMLERSLDGAAEE